MLFLRKIRAEHGAHRRLVTPLQRRGPFRHGEAHGEDGVATMCQNTSRELKARGQQ